MQRTQVPLVREDCPCWRATEPHAPQLLKPACHRACALQQEKPPQWEGQASQLESRLCSPQPEKACAKQWRPSAAKNKLTNEFFKKDMCSFQTKKFQFQNCTSWSMKCLDPSNCFISLHTERKTASNICVQCIHWGQEVIHVYWVKESIECSVAQACQILLTVWTVACQAPLSMGFSRQESWTGLPFLPAGYLPDPGIEPESSALVGGFFTTAPSGRPKNSDIFGEELRSSCTLVRCGWSFWAVNYDLGIWKIKIIWGDALVNWTLNTSLRGTKMSLLQ